MNLSLFNLLLDFQRIAPASVRFNLEVAVCLNDWLNATDEGVESIICIRLLWPETITDLLLCKGVVIRL